MGIFPGIFSVFGRNKPHKKLEDAYLELNDIASNLRKQLHVLQKLNRQLVEERIDRLGDSQETGGIGLKKTLFIEEELLHKLEKLEKKAEERFNQATELITSTEPVSAEEQAELTNITEHLKELKQLRSWKSIGISSGHRLTGAGLQTSRAESST